MPVHKEFTPALINAINATKQELHSSKAQPALKIMAQPSGRKNYCITYRDGSGKSCNLPIGNVGECTHTRLEEANTVAEFYVRVAKSGGDPKAIWAERQAQSHRPRAAVTLTEAWEAYSTSARYRGLRANTKKLYSSTWNTHLSALGDRLLVSFTLKDLVEFYDQVTDGGEANKGIARAAIIVFEGIWKSAKRHELIPPGTPKPTEFLNDELPGWRSVKKKEVDLEDQYLRDFWRATYSRDVEVEGQLVHHPIGAAVRFTLLTGLRHTNVIRLLWEHVDLDNRMLRLPAEVMKGKRDFLCPLTDLAMAELLAMRHPDDEMPYLADGRWVFGRLTKSAVRAAQEAVGAVKAPKRRVPLDMGDLPGGLLNRQIGIWAKEAGVPHSVTAHTLRKTFARWANREGDYGLAAYLLHHAPPSHVTHVYLVDDLNQIRAGAQRVADRLRDFFGDAYMTREPRSSYYRAWKDLNTPDWPET